MAKIFTTDFTSRDRGSGRYLSLEDKIKILHGYDIHQGNASAVAREINHTSPAVRKVWKDLGFKLNENIDYGKYGGHLGYYNAHPEMHGLPRGRMAREYPSLYRALIRSKEIDLAIPHIIPREERNTGRKPLPESEVDKIVKVFYTNNKNVLRTANDTKHDPTLIRKYLRSRGIQLEGKRGRPRKDKLKHENPY